MKLNGSVTRAGFIDDIADRSTDLAGLGFFPGTFGSISVVLSSIKVSPYYSDEFNDNYYKFQEPLKALRNRFVLLTRPNLTMRSIGANRSKSQEFLGILRITPSGDGFQLMWGFYRQKLDFNQIYHQLYMQNEAMKKDENNTIIVYTSPNYLQHYSYFGDENDDFQFTYNLWASFPQLVKTTSQGIGLVNRFGHSDAEFLQAMREKISKYNTIVVKSQGVILVAQTWDEVLQQATILDRAAQSALTIGDLKNDIKLDAFAYLTNNLSEINPEILTWIKSKESSSHE